MEAAREIILYRLVLLTYHLQEFRIPVMMPANGEAVSIPGIANLEVDVPQDIVQRCIELDPTPSKKACPFSACLIMDKQVRHYIIVDYVSINTYICIYMHMHTYTSEYVYEVLRLHYFKVMITEWSGSDFLRGGCQ